jgi:hypothetical protein
MGHYLHAPHAVSSSNPKRTRLNATERDSSPVVPDPVSSLPQPPVPTAVPADSPAIVRRSTRSRRPLSSESALPLPASSSRVPVFQRWHYALPPAALRASILTYNLTPQGSLGESRLTTLCLAPTPRPLLPTLFRCHILRLPHPRSSVTATAFFLVYHLCTRVSPGCLRKDDRSDAQADNEWHQATQINFPDRSRLPVTPALLAYFTRASSVLPVVQFDTATAYFRAPSPAYFPRIKPQFKSGPAHPSGAGIHLQV